MPVNPAERERRRREPGYVATFATSSNAEACIPPTFFPGEREDSATVLRGNTVAGSAELEPAYSGWSGDAGEPCQFPPFHTRQILCQYRRLRPNAIENSP